MGLAELKCNSTDVDVYRLRLCLRMMHEFRRLMLRLLFFLWQIWKLLFKVIVQKIYVFDLLYAAVMLFDDLLKKTLHVSVVWLLVEGKMLAVVKHLEYFRRDLF